MNIINESDLTALMVASESGNRNIAQLLLDSGADVNQKNNKGSIALMYATNFNHAKKVEFLL